MKKINKSTWCLKQLNRRQSMHVSWVSTEAAMPAQHSTKEMGSPQQQAACTNHSFKGAVCLKILSMCITCLQENASLDAFVFTRQKKPVG